MRLHPSTQSQTIHSLLQAFTHRQHALSHERVSSLQCCSCFCHATTPLCTIADRSDSPIESSVKERDNPFSAAPTFLFLMLRSSSFGFCSYQKMNNNCQTSIWGRLSNPVLVSWKINNMVTNSTDRLFRLEFVAQVAALHDPRIALPLLFYSSKILFWQNRFLLSTAAWITTQLQVQRREEK